MAMTVNVNVDDRTMQQFDTLCDKLGMDAGTAISLFMNKAIRVHGLPFDITLDYDENLDDPFYSPENTEELKKALIAFDNGKSVVHEVNYDD
ncbi:MAG: type II toxin-antitoxin system RelB/DinJ family antitoxin [Oscillospiraceae bacterium]|nr:type II toxin-antitoxin system RelB/DinJ family antitoxin [Oscillospiraceae bacterium]